MIFFITQYNLLLEVWKWKILGGDLIIFLILIRYLPVITLESFTEMEYPLALKINQKAVS